MSHSSSQTAISLVDCGSRDLTHTINARVEKHPSTSRREEKKSNSALFGFNCRFQSGTSLHDKPVGSDGPSKKEKKSTCVSHIRL